MSRHEPFANLRRLGGLAMAALAVVSVSGCASMFSTAGASSSRADRKVIAEAADGENAAEGETASIESAEEARRQAAEAFAAGDLDKALYLFVEAVSLDPQDSHSFYAIGAIHENRGNQALAMRAYSQAVEADPTHALAQQQLGAARLRTRDLDGAKTALEAAIAANPKLWRAHDLLGVVADMQERHDDAIGHYSQAIALQPSEPSLVNNRGYSWYLSGNYEAAEADFLLALRLDQDYDRAWKNLGLVRARQQRYDEALTMMERVVARHIAANDVGYIAMLNGDYARARQLLTQAISLSPRFYPTAVDNLAKLDQAQSSSDLLMVTSEVKEFSELER